METFYFLWFNVSRLIFVIFCIQYFKTTIYFISFNVSRRSIFHTHKKLFAFPFIIFTFTPLYTHVHSLSYHPISNTLRKKMMSFSFNLSMTHVQPHSWIPGLSLAWARFYLGSQLICVVGLSFLLWVILDKDSMRSLFSPSLLDFLLAPSNPFFPPQFLLFIVLS